MAQQGKTRESEASEKTDEYKLYLAGPIFDDDHPNRWREDVISGCNIGNASFVNPLDLEVDLDNPEDIVNTDLKAISDCDAVVVRWKDDTQTAGTPMEMMYAKHAVDIPVVVWYVGYQDELSPWVRHYSDKIVTKGSGIVREVLKEI